MSSSGSSGSGAASATGGKGRGARGRRGQLLAQGGDAAPGGPPSAPEPEAPRDAAPPRSPTRSTQEPGDLSDDMKKLAVATANIKRVVDRPGLGTIGRGINLLANFFAIGFKGDAQLCVHRYQTEIAHPNPRRLKMDKDETRKIFWECIKTNEDIFNKSQIVFDDSRCAYTLDKLSFPGGQLKHKFTVRMECDMDNRPQDYTMEMQFTGSHVVDLTMTATQIHEERTHTAIQVVDLILSQGLRCPIYPRAQGWHPFGRGIYRLPTQQIRAVDLGGGREMWSGFTSAAKVGGNWKPLLNVDVSNTAFVKPTSLMEFCIDVVNGESGGGGMGGGGGRGGRGGRGGGRGGYNGRGGDTPRYSMRDYHPQQGLPNDMQQILGRNLKGLKLKTTHMPNNRVYKFQAVERPASELMFTMSDGQELSVAQYFEGKYGALQYPHLPCIQVGPKAKKLYVPMEMLHIYSPQKVLKKLTEQQTSTMIRQSARPANERKQLIDNLIRDSQLGTDPFMTSFGMSMSMDMAQVKGRILDPQSLVYDQQRKIPVRDGTWSCEKGGFRFFNPGTCRGYSLISFVQDQEMLQAFCGNLAMTCDTFGMRFRAQWPDCVKYVRTPEEIQGMMELCIKETEANYQDAKCELIFVVMRGKNSQAYSEVKRWGEIELGLMTQCILVKNAKKIAEDRSTTGATAVNVAMKINMKMGGINCDLVMNQVWDKFAGEKNATLFLGVDVTHPGAGDTKSPSIGAVVGNVDFQATRYGASIKVQPHRREHLLYLQDTVRERMLQYYLETKRRPERIIVYRDGVSEGQFMQVLNEEMASMREACTKLGEDYKPAITYIVVQKRHHTRFFTQNPREAVGRAQNIPPGTVVDTVITHPCEFDFYLCSHFGIQGTSRPTHYYVLHDENGFSADELQMVSYQLCHLYGRCTRVVSIPAPVYFADLCCTRARYHVRSKIGIVESASSTGRQEGDSSETSENELTEAVTLHDIFKNAMYFS